jgi:hypothetical protein
VKQASDDETTILFVINQIKKKYAYGNNIEAPLDSLQQTDLQPFKPLIQLSQDNDNELRPLEN